MPTRLRTLIATLAASLATAGIAAGEARAQDCLHWGELDKTLYCDENRDLVADTPSQGYQLVDPDTLVFSRAAADDLLPDEKAFAGFVEHLAKRTGKPVRWSSVASSADQIKAMRDGKTHLAVISPGPTVYAVNLAGYVPLAVMCTDDGTFDNSIELIAAKGADIDAPGKLKGGTLARVSALSSVGDLEATGYETVFTGSESKSITGAAESQYDAALVNSDVIERARAQNLAGAGDLKVVWESRGYPPTSFGFAHNLAPDLQRKIHDAFLTFDWKGSALAQATGDRTGKFCTVSYQEDWESIRLQQEEQGVVYDVKDLR